MKTDYQRSIFTEMAIGLHWILFLYLAILHFQYAQSHNLLMTAILMAYGVYLMLELYFFAIKQKVFFERFLNGYFEIWLDLLVLVGASFVYPHVMSILLPLLCVLILVFSLKNAKTSALNHGMMGAVVYSLSLTHLHPMLKINWIEVMVQSFMLLAYSFVVSEVKFLFHGVLDKNHHAMEEIAYKNQLLEQSAKTDFLTNMYNHQAFYQSLDRAATKLVPITLILFDIDYFKSINDGYGHVTGDYVIREIANLIKQYLRTSDIAARYGGEEFAVLLPGTSLEAGKKIAERIRSAIESHVFSFEQHTLSVTISGGVGMSTYILPDKQEQSAFVDYVDTLLYQSKRNGRNRITVAELDEKRTIS